MKVKYYKSERGIFFSLENAKWANPIERYRINDVVPEPTHSQKWFFLPEVSEITSVKEKQERKLLEQKFHLIDESKFVDGIIPLVLTMNDVIQEYDDDLEETVWRNEKYAFLKAAYRQENIYSEECFINTEYELEFLGDIQFEKTQKGEVPKYSVLVDDMWPHRGERNIDLSSVTCYEELDKMLTPELLLHNKPCSISSHQSYEIIRKYVKDNIDPKWAVITSDYNFCFVVKKKVSIKPYIKKIELTTTKGKSYKPPRFKQRTVEYKEFEIFEMTHKGPNGKYGNYTPLEGFSGDNFQDLCSNVKNYLDELMDYINCPASECQHCQGRGNIFEDKFKLNKRET